MNKKLNKWGLLPCFYCEVDSPELKFFLFAVIGGLSLAALFFGVYFYINGYFKNTEELNDLPIRLEEKKE